MLFTPNPEQIVLASKDKSFAEALCQADIVIPDGIGLVFASRLFSLAGRGAKIVERIPGVDIVQKLLHQAKEKKLKVLVIGGMAYSGLSYKSWQIRELDHLAAQKNQATIQNNVAAGLWWTPAFEDARYPTSKEQSLLEKHITALSPDIIFVAFGAPTQEKWVIENRKLLEKQGVQLAMVVGGAFDMLLGKVDRAPKLIRTLGLEWLFRLVQEPWRWRRQLRLVEFVKLVIGDLLQLRT